MEEISSFLKGQLVVDAFGAQLGSLESYVVVVRISKLSMFRNLLFFASTDCAGATEQEAATGSLPQRRVYAPTCCWSLQT